MKKSLIILILLFFCSVVCASDWFVRPAGGSYGSENGTDYDNAWDGFANVVWGGAGVVAGDTLYICGLHLRTYSALPQYTEVGAVTSGADDDNRVIIRGDYPGDSGIVWGAGIFTPNSWTKDSDTNMYHQTCSSTHFNDWCFDDISATGYTVLTRQDTVDDVNSTPGSFLYDTTNKKLYVHCLDGGDPEGTVALNASGYQFSLSGTSYVTFLNLKFYCDSNHRMLVNGIDGDGASHITFDGCTIWYGRAAIMHFRPNNNYITFQNCDLAWAENGLDFSEGGGGGDGSTSPSNCLISNNKIHDIGVTYTNADAHAVSWQGGRSNIIEKNTMWNCGTTICLYQLNVMDVIDTVIRWNLIRDPHILGTEPDKANGYGIEMACEDGDYHENTTGNHVYGNRVINAVIGYRYKYVNQHFFYNNVAEGCDTSFYYIRSNGPSDNSFNVKMRNCVSLNPTNYHVEIHTNENEGKYTYDGDYNSFYPVSGDQFVFVDNGNPTSYLTFAEWQALSKSGCTFDTYSFSSDPTLGGDMSPKMGSPLINEGADVSAVLTIDQFDTPVPFNGGTDIGFMEFNPGLF